MGAEAIGQSVCREFEPHGFFTGTITAYRKEKETRLYTVEYTDGDVEDLDDEEYNHAYEVWLRQSGWEPEDQVIQLDAKSQGFKTKTTKIRGTARKRIEEVIDLTASSTIAGKHLQSMTDIEKSMVIETAEKNHKKLENKNVKAAVLEVQYAALCHAAFVAHLQKKVTPVKEMQHFRRKTLVEEQGMLAKVKIGDWIFATEDMSPGKNSEGGYGCVVALHYKVQCVAYEEGDVDPILASVDAHWLIPNRLERHVNIERLTVVSTAMSSYLFGLVSLSFFFNPAGAYALPTRHASLTPSEGAKRSKNFDAESTAIKNANWMAGIWPGNKKA